MVGKMAGRILLFVLIAGIKVYRIALSPFVGRSCRFVPSCSHYAEDALRAHGPARGSWMALKRIARCHPWSEGGFDPIPRAQSSSAQSALQQVPQHAEVVR